MLTRILIAGCALVLPLQAQDTSPETLAKVRKVLARWDESEGPGLALGIISDGELVLGEGFGLANMEHGIPNGPELTYRIGSTSKQFTATCIALLHLDGKLDLDAPVTDFFPAFKPAEPPITVRNLIHHTSGLRDYIGIQFRAGGGDKAWFTPEQSVQAVATAELEFKAGERFSYSNSNYLLMGEIVKRTSGKSLRDFAQERIFTPLEMHDSSFQDRHDQVVVGRSHGYSPQREEGRGDWKVDITHLDHVGDGGVFTTIEDLVKWDANFYDNKLGYGQEFLDLMHTHGVLNDGKQLPYCFALGVEPHRGLNTVSHGGAWVGYRAEMLRFPAQRFSVIILANQSTTNASRLAKRIADICMADVYAE